MPEMVRAEAAKTFANQRQQRMTATMRNRRPGANIHRSMIVGADR